MAKNSVNTSMGLSAIHVAEAKYENGQYVFPSTGIASLGDVYKNTCTLTDSEPTITTHASETSNRKLHQTGETDTTITLQLMDPDIELLAKYFGGSVTTDSSSKKSWVRPRELPYKEFAIELTPDEGLFVSCKSCRIIPRFEITYNSEGICLVPLTINLIEPLEVHEAEQMTISA